jgi:hypothetical protein
MSPPPPVMRTDARIATCDADRPAQGIDRDTTGPLNVASCETRTCKAWSVTR